MIFGTAEKLCIIYTKVPTRRYVALDHDLTPSFTNDLDQAALFATAHVKEWIGSLVWHALINNENQVSSVSLRDAMTTAFIIE